MHDKFQHQYFKIILNMETMVKKVSSTMVIGEEGFKYFLANFNCNGGTFLRKMFSAKSFPQGWGGPIGGRNLPNSCLGIF